MELEVLDTRALQKASGVSTNYRLDLLALQMSDVTMEALNQQMIILFSKEKAMKVTSFVQDSLYMRESYHQV